MPALVWILLCLAPQEGVERARQALGPSPRALVAALADDGVPGNAQAAWEQLVQLGEPAREALAAGLHAADPQQRFLSATALAHAGPQAEDTAQICAILWPHLEANHVAGDLEMAQAALARMGSGPLAPAVVAWIREARRRSGGQATAAIEGIGLRLGLHDDWQRVYAWPALQPRFVLPASAAWPMQQPRSTEWTVERHATELVLALGEDDLGRNATVARRELTARIHEAPMRRALQRALFDPDRQRRQYAWGIWVHALFPYGVDAATVPPDEVPWQTLDQMALEALEEDDLAGGHSRWRIKVSSDYFRRRGRHAWPVLRRGLLSDDPLQRTRCAVLQVVMGDPLAGGSIHVLQEALQDNRIRNDQMAAEHALISAGPVALKWLETLGPARDHQERAARVRIQQHIRKLTPALQERHSWRALTRLYALSELWR